MKQLNVEKLAELVSAHAREELADNRIGVKELIVHQEGKRVYRARFGPEGTEALPERLLFRAASMTKPITSAAVALLAGRGLLDLREPAYNYYPQMKDLQVATVENGKIVSLRPAKNVIRVSDLLCHTSGIGSSPVSETLEQSCAKLPLREAVREILTHPLAFEPRTAQAYSGTDAFDVAAGIVEIVSGTSFDGFLQKNLFAPLHMTDTTFRPDKEQWSRIAPMHNRTADGNSETVSMTEGCLFADFVPERMSAGAGLASTAEDYIRFADMLCSGGLSEDGERVMTEDAVRAMRTPQLPEEVEMYGERWGLGMRIVIAPGYPHGLGVGCFGWSGAYGTHFWVDPENRLSVVMMKNSLYDGGAGNQSACALERDVSASLL